ncbi:hypothetical protein ABPG75_002735 [Micractinium tetrahymenae]
MEVSQAELARRQRQRELRELALKLRAEGKLYKKGKKKHKPRRRVQVVVIPIVWQKKKAEAALVMNAAEAAVQALREAGVKADIDSTTELTPGQKMRAWEEKGVKLRVEVGPKEAEQGRVVLARAKKPGEVADKQTVAAGEELCRFVQEELEAMGQQLQPPAAAPQAEGAAAPAAAAGELAPGSGKRHQAAAGSEQQRQQGQQQQHQQQHQHVPAEDVAGDFAGQFEGQSTGKKAKTGQQKQQAVEDEVAAFNALTATDGDDGKKKKKAKKVVVF